MKKRINLELINLIEYTLDELVRNASYDIQNSLEIETRLMKIANVGAVAQQAIDSMYNRPVGEEVDTDDELTDWVDFDEELEYAYEEANKQDEKY